jgi:hypothetical protein
MTLVEDVTFLRMTGTYMFPCHANSSGCQEKKQPTVLARKLIRMRKENEAALLAHVCICNDLQSSGREWNAG